MLGLSLQKIRQKKWMVLSLLIGCILLIATAVSFPLYQKAAYDRMLRGEMTAYMSREGNWPMVMYTTASLKKDKEGTIDMMEDYTANLYDLYGLDEYESVYYYSHTRTSVTSDINREDAEDVKLSLSAMTGLKDHAVMISGEMYSEDGISDDGAIEVIVPQATLIAKGLIVGEKLTFKQLKLPDGRPVTVRVVGVYTGLRSDDFYFQVEPESMNDTCMMEPELFKSYFTGEHASDYNLDVTFYDLFDYRTVTASQVDGINELTEYLCDESPDRNIVRSPNFRTLFSEYEIQQKRITATLLILQIPILMLLAAFLIMISDRMYQLEKNEISVIKSRGSSRGQIFLIYVYQGLFITCVGAAIGIPLGALFAKVLGSTRNFLEFDLSDPVHIEYTAAAFLYALFAMIITLGCISLPAIKYSGITIVGLKQQRSLRKKSFWEKIYLDVIFIAISLYGFYSFRRNADTVAVSVLEGDSLDPLLYISSSLFIIGAGLLFLRIQPYIIRLIYLCGKKFCGPAGYVSFMDNIRNGRKTQLIQLFLIMTIALGMYHATVARTILENAAVNTEYADGVDVVMQEFWQMVSGSSGSSQYIEPDGAKYQDMDFAESYTRVYVDDNAYLGFGRGSRTSVTVMGIHTREFGSITSLESDFNEMSYHSLLNTLAQTEDGVLLSRNFESVQGLAVGDVVDVNTDSGNKLSLKIVGFFDYFPTYVPYESVINPDGSVDGHDHYLMVMNSGYYKKCTGSQPYEVWIDLKDDATAQDIYDFVRAKNMRLTKYVNKADDLEAAVTDPLLQGTNGVLTMGFCVTMLLCAVGYLIYWIMSIKDRELMFGVLRASGLHKAELVRIVVADQIFSGGFSILAGIVIGRLTSYLFVPLMQASYASSGWNLPMRLITVSSDMYRIYAIVAAVMLACIGALVFILFQMNVTKALKIGEE